VLKIACPNCGAEVTFRSPALPTRVCDYCRTMLVRSDEGVAMAGQAAALPFDVSPVQIGTRGSFEGRQFDVIGRIRWGWTDGSWNEWLLLFGDGSHAWLGEAMGQFMVTWERPLADVGAKAVRDLAAGRHVAIGTEALIDKTTMIVADAREARCIAAEGELPFTAPPGWTVFSVDFRSGSGRAASLQRDGSDANFYIGRYVTLDELAPAGLRQIEGWQMPVYGR
jgi:hypothetical protein